MPLSTQHWEAARNAGRGQLSIPWKRLYSKVTLINLKMGQKQKSFKESTDLCPGEMRKNQLLKYKAREVISK